MISNPILPKGIFFFIFSINKSFSYSFALAYLKELLIIDEALSQLILIFLFENSAAELFVNDSKPDFDIQYDIKPDIGFVPYKHDSFIITEFLL